MQLHILITVTAFLIPQLVSTQNITRWLEIQAAFPPCARSCINDGWVLSGISPTDINRTCNDATFLNTYVGPCESAEAGNCNDEDRQNIATLASAGCGPVGGISSTVYTFRFPGLPACANNCTSSGLRFSGCQGDNTTCICKNPSFANAYGPCVESICNASDIADTVSFFTSGCASVGGIGPFNASDIQGFLSFTGPNRTLPYYPPFYTPENATLAINGTNATSATNTTNVTYSSSPPIAPFNSAAASTMMGHYSRWSMLGLIGAIMLVKTRI